MVLFFLSGIMQCWKSQCVVLKAVLKLRHNSIPLHKEIEVPFVTFPLHCAGCNRPPLPQVLQAFRVELALCRFTVKLCFLLYLVKCNDQVQVAVFLRWSAGSNSFWLEPSSISHESSTPRFFVGFFIKVNPPVLSTWHAVQADFVMKESIPQFYIKISLSKRYSGWKT